MTSTTRPSQRRPRRTERSTRGRRDQAREPRRRPRRSEEERARAAERPSRPTRRRYLLRRWMLVLVVLALLGIGYVIMFTPVLGVRSVEVHGVRELPVAAVREKADIAPGTPLARLDTNEVERRVATLPRVFSVQVSRSLPDTVEITIVERKPVAVLQDETGLYLIDRTGLDYATVDQAPPGLPTLTVPAVGEHDPATKAAVDVLATIPKQLRAQVVAVAATTPGDVRLTLADGRVVRWGDADDSTRKAAVLAPLLTQPGSVFDVSTPDFPTIS
jgi:cell division protein FtsQ